MTQNQLTQKQEEQISNLIGMIISQSKLFPESKPLLVKIPFSLLQGVHISPSEAKDLIRSLNRSIEATEKVYVEVLNGTIVEYEGTVGTMPRGGTFAELEEVDVGDDKESLILWVNDLEEVKKRTESFLALDISKTGLKSSYENGEIRVGKRSLKIRQNTNDADFCRVVFAVKPSIPISWADVWEAVKDTPFDNFRDKNLKVIENIISNLNKKLKAVGVDKLFSQRKHMVYRNY